MENTGDLGFGEPGALKGGNGGHLPPSSLLVPKDRVFMLTCIPQLRWNPNNSCCTVAIGVSLQYCVCVRTVVDHEGGP